MNRSTDNAAKRCPWTTVLAGVMALTLVAAAIGSLGETGRLRRWLHQLDQRWLDERIMDTLARVSSSEDWSRAEPLRATQDDRWRQAEDSGMVRIAHALGESGGETANTVPAMRRAYRAGFRLFEVDLWQQGTALRCHHGPEPPPPLQPGDCRLDTLMAALPPDAWVVLDLKTDFERAGEEVLELMRRTGQATQVIFQLYEPGHLTLFNRWQSQQPFPAPIVSIYRAHRSVNHVAAATARLRTSMLTLPLERLPALSNRPPGLALYVHPVHDCAALEQARTARVRGIYTLTALSCPEPLPHGE